jgi:hypothetical protein
MPDYRYYGNDDYRFTQTQWQPERAQRDGLLAAALKGAAAGIVGTAALSLGLHYGPTLMQRAGLLEPPPPGAEPEPPQEKLAASVADVAADAELDDTTKAVAGQAIHWSYGALWGAAYGVAQRELQWPAPLAGAALGGVVAGVASTLVPALQLTPPPTEQPVAQSAMMGALNMVYGEVTALAFGVLE